MNGASPVNELLRVDREYRLRSARGPPPVNGA
jgi:hypothetical protein